MSFFRPNRYPGKLIAIEGIDGAGKSTQLRLLAHWLRSLDASVVEFEWRGFPVDEPFTPTSLALQHCDSFMRCLDRVKPALKNGSIVCADEYALAGMTRDLVRGMSRRWAQNLYAQAFKPAVTIYLRLPVEIAMRRLKPISPLMAGMDLGLSLIPEESFRLFQGRLASEYEAMAREHNFQIIDATAAIRDQQLQIREIVKRIIPTQRKQARAAAAASIH